MAWVESSPGTDPVDELVHQNLIGAPHQLLLVVAVVRGLQEQPDAVAVVSVNDLLPDGESVDPGSAR